jgi:hypothetical protein
MNSIPNGTIQSIHEPANRSGYLRMSLAVI